MAEFFITPKKAPSSANKASSGVSERMSKNAGKKVTMKSGKGHFAAAAQRIAKKRSGHLQHGVPKHAPMGGPQVGHSGIVKKGPGLTAQPTDAQVGLNPEQQGA